MQMIDFWGDPFDPTNASAPQLLAGDYLLRFKQWQSQDIEHLVNS